MTKQLDQLNDDHFKRQVMEGKFPDRYKGKPKKSKSESQQLQNDIVKFCKLNNQFCEPVHTKGTYRKELGIYTAGNYIKGSADLHIMLWRTDGTLVVWKCEVKWNKDVQSEDQRKYQQMIHKFNDSVQPRYGIVIYSIVKTFDDFLNQYEKLIN